MGVKRKRFRFKKKFRILFYVFLASAAIFILFRLVSSKYTAYGISIPKGYSVHGIDISRYQGKIDWPELVKIRSGKDSLKIDFVFIKATEGRSITDPTFKYNWEGAKKSGVMRGAYHYFIPNRSAKEQADNFIANVKLEKGDLPPVLDVEVTGKYGNAKLVENIKIWLEQVEKHYKIKPILYTYIDFYEINLLGKGFDDYPLWIAHYYKDKLKINEPWLFWQHSDKGQIESISDKVDFNVFSGTLEELNMLRKK